MAAQRPGLRFTHLRLENWRNFRSVEIDVQRRAFIVGPNASGKSNLLDAIRFLRDIASVGGGFQDAVGRRGGVSRLRCLAARQQPDVGIGVSIGNDDDPHVWEYEVKFGSTRGRDLVRTESVRNNGRTIHERPEQADRDDPERLTQTSLEQVTANKDFRAVADFFADVRYLHLVPQLIREPDRSVGRINDPYGGDFLEQLARTSKATRDARLRRISEALKVAVPQLAELKMEPDERGDWHLKGKYKHWRPTGAWHSESDFSDGTLRLLGLLWAVLDGAGPLLLEEPELSLHPEVIRFLPPLFARAQRRSSRQVLVSTHSVDLLRDEGIGLDEVLILVPGENGSEVSLASSIDDARTLLLGGTTLPELVIPRTRPRNVAQLALFDR